MADEGSVTFTRSFADEVAAAFGLGGDEEEDDDDVEDLPDRVRQDRLGLGAKSAKIAAAGKSKISAEISAAKKRRRVGDASWRDENKDDDGEEE